MKKRKFWTSWFNNVKDTVVQAVDPMIGKTVIVFETSGCMAQIHEFKYIGTITGSRVKTRENRSEAMDFEWTDEFKYYTIDVLKGFGGEKGNTDYSIEKEVPSWYLRELSEQVYICYDC